MTWPKWRLAQAASPGLGIHNHSSIGGSLGGAAGASHLMGPTHVLEAFDCASSKHPLLTCKFTMWHEKTKEQCKAKAQMLQVVTGCTLFQ